MVLTQQSVDASTGTTEQGDKMMQMCKVIEHCCTDMSDADKKKMMQDMMPRMMHIMGDGRGTGMMDTMMKTCMHGFRWFPLIPVTVGTALFLLGYFLEAEVVRVLFLILAAVPVMMGLLGFFMFRTMIR